MAKNSLPSVEGVLASVTVKSGAVGEVDIAVAEIKPVEAEGYIPRNVDVRMNRTQAKILRDKLRQLQDAGAKTADGKFVDNRAQAVRWILENEVIL
jgi:hypothetical protein